MGAIREAQTKLSELAAQFEQRIRYANPSEAGVDHIQDGIGKERDKNESSLQ